jgi:hypothetical protein
VGAVDSGAGAMMFGRRDHPTAGLQMDDHGGQTPASQYKSFLVTFFTKNVTA